MELWTPQFQNLPQNNYNQYKVIVSEEQTQKSIEQILRVRNKPIHIWSTDFQQGAKSIQWRKEQFFKKMAQGQMNSHMYKNEFESYIIPDMKINSKLDEISKYKN